MSRRPNDPVTLRANRRKACDLCFLKKIKCDLLRPICSNCILYDTECRTSNIRRNTKTPKSRLAPTSQGIGQCHKKGLAAHLATIEDQLQKVLQDARDAQQAVQKTDSLPEDAVGVINQAHEESPLEYSLFQQSTYDEKNQTYWSFNPLQPCLYDGPRPATLSLPALGEILPVIDHYFLAFNAITPLFHRGIFMKLLDGWYNNRISRDKRTWAAIQIVLALGFRAPQMPDLQGMTVEIEKSNICLQRAQSIIPDLVMRDGDLLSVQTLLGIALLFQSGRDPGPASVIMGIAMKLVHRLHLHTKESSECLSAEEADQRSHVFWIAYVLDKHISFRTTTPATQLDSDIDLPLPISEPLDGSGLMWTRDGQSCFNYHRTRVELAYIEGKVYDLLYSNRSSNIGGMERYRRVSHLQTMLDEWCNRIPIIFHIEHAAMNVGSVQLTQLTTMYHIYLLTQVMVHGLYSHNADWMKGVSSSSQKAIEGLFNGPDKRTSLKYHNIQQAPLHEGWGKCVELSRGCMKLFQETTPTESVLWQCTCAHFASLVIILSNVAFHPTHEMVTEDQQLALKSLGLYDKMLEIIDDEYFRSMRSIVGELSEKANAAIARQQPEPCSSAHSVFDSLGGDLSFLDSSTEPGLDCDLRVGAFDGLHASNAFEDSLSEQLPSTGVLCESQGMSHTLDFEDFLN